MSTVRADLGLQMKRQLLFLRNSAALYDAGHVEEAVRIAVVIRILMHDTHKSVSLLKHMGSKDTLMLTTTVRPIDPALLVGIDFGDLMDGMTFGASLTFDPVPRNSPAVTCGEWWNQGVYVYKSRQLSRKQVVLATAHMDGGAHVADPDHDLLAVMEGGWIQTTTNDDGTQTSKSLINNHFRMLRRFADELMNSLDLLQLGHP